MTKRKRKTSGTKKRGRCILCGEAVGYKATRWSLTNFDLLAVMLSSHVVYEGIDVEHAKFIFEACIIIRKRICHRHFANGAKYLVAELKAIGVTFSYYEDDTVLLGTAAYVNQRDIPTYMVDRLNEVVLKLDKNRHITARDVTRFINGSLRHYYSVRGWDSVSRVFPRKRRKNREKDQTQLQEGPQEPLYSNDIKHEEGSENVNHGISVSELAGPSSCSISSVQAESNADTSNVKPTSSPVLVRPLPRLERTDPALLRHSFIVDGEALLKMFKFCLKCGQKLDADGSVRLVMDGAAPMVQYVCDRCSQEEPIIKNWKAQRDYTWSK